MLTKLLNRGRVQKIGIVDQFIMAYGGLRGAVCYGLVMSLDSVKVPAKNMYATTTIVVILFTVFIQVYHSIISYIYKNVSGSDY
jgi:NhaP-type Na+/H+ or K+/H+ antiporter